MKEVTSSYNAEEVEGRVRTFWNTHDTYAGVRELRSSGKPFFFVDGPPYTTGYIHLGTAWNKILKDTILRYHRMCGRHIIERAGYDMHGLPIEVKVEHELGFTSKKDIEEYGIARFIEKCRTFAETHMEIMSEQFRNLGVWLDFDDPYQTVKDEYIEAAWWTLGRAEERGLLERGHRVVNWCPRCETAIADSEVEYWDETDPSVFVKFPVKGRDDEYLVIWTTTPWTLPANVGVAVDKNFIYAKVLAKRGDTQGVLWIAEDLIEPVLRRGRYTDYEVLEKVPGDAMVGMEYTSPLCHAVPRQCDMAHRVVVADFVTMENTGMVHIAPGHGWDDYLLGIREGLEIFCPVDGTGCFTPDAGAYAGMHVRDSNAAIMDDLGALLLASEEIIHRYGHCWRCKTPIIYRATEQWFLKVTEIRDRMLEEIREVSWFPDWAGSARFHDFVKDARDWCISRQRYWGIPIPIWECTSCKDYRVISTIAELEEAGDVRLSDPHRPYVDEITIPCRCGATMHRVEEIFDVWFDSAVASWATLGFPRRQDGFERYWPADFITEGQDQTRGWFYSQLGASTIAFDRSPYRSVLMHGFALDADGRKMSKSFGNVVTPEEVISQYGVDVLRLYILSASAPWDDLKFNWDSVKTTGRAMNILWNVYRFPIPYMLIDGFEPVNQGGVWDDSYIRDHLSGMPDEDRWIISRVNTIAGEVKTGMETYQLHKVCRALISFVLDDLSRWYVQLVRPRMWLEEDSPEKRFAYETMYYVMRRLVQVSAPVIPHITEEIYHNLCLEGDPESVHMLDTFAGLDDCIDPELEREMEILRSFDDAVANARQAGRRKLRWPVLECVVATGNQQVKSALDNLNSLARVRANSKQVTVVVGQREGITWRAVPVMRTIGPEFGKDAAKIRAAIAAADGTAVKSAIESGGRVEMGGFSLSGEHLTFTEVLPDDVFVADMQDGKVYVNVTLTPEIEGEGYAREIIRRLQDMRRQLDLNVDDFIRADVEVSDARVADLVLGVGGSKGSKDLIAAEVRAEPLNIRVSSGEAPPPGGACDLEIEWDVEGVKMLMRISRASRQSL